MRIAVNARFLLAEYLEGFGYFTFELFQRIVRNYPEHQFIFIFDRAFDQRFTFAPNILPVVVGPPARTPLLWRFWYNVKLPRVLKKYKADVFVSADNFCSLRTSVPQCLVLHDLAFLHYPKYIRRSHLPFLKKNMPRFLGKAKTIVTVSDFSKNDIVKQYQIDPTQIAIVPNAARNIFHPVSDEVASGVKNKYTNGTEFFLYVGSIHPRKNLVTLLKAFSIFKKRLKSNFKLILAGRLAWHYESFLNDLKTYKYREDVILTGYLPEEELAVLMASCYGFVYPSLFEGFGVPVLEAMQSQVPVITSSGSAMADVAAEAALYADPNSFEDWGEKLMLLYKDDNLRKQLIEKGKEVSKLFSWESSAKRFWETIQKTAG